MAGRFLLDSNIVIALFAGDASVQERLGEADEVFVSSTVRGELYFGAEKSARARDNLTRIDAFAAASTILSCDADTAREYGSIKNRLREKGRPLPENDIWVAATARQFGLVLATRDDHFNDVEGLKRESW